MMWSTFNLQHYGFKAEVCHQGCKAMGTEPGGTKRKHVSIDTMSTKERETMPYQLCFQLSLAVMSYLMKV